MTNDQTKAFMPDIVQEMKLYNLTNLLG